MDLGNMNMTAIYGDTNSVYVMETTTAVLDAQKFAITVDILLVSISCALFVRKINWGFRRPLIPSRCLVLMSLAASWVFNVSATLLIIFSLGDSAACQVAILYCAVLYAANKLIIYLFLIEKAHIISGAPTRLGNKMYWVNFLLLAPYGVIEILMLIYRIHILDPNTGQCHIGIKRPSSLPLIIYDTVYSVWLNLNFLWPLIRNDFESEFHAIRVSTSGKGASTSGYQQKKRNMCKRTYICSLLSLISSFLNILILVIFDGGLWSFVCLSGCMIDITFNAGLLSWITSKANDDTRESKDSSDNAAVSSGPGATKSTLTSSRRNTLGLGVGSAPPLPSQQLASTYTKSTASYFPPEEA
ncbi:hypothetical protein HDU76_009307 [Blyttiomyces sp. JEL0837]|nr:hypothetical protein HDU76_009307 [Blyttiomyces sp. JEL0837]